MRWIDRRTGNLMALATNDIDAVEMAAGEAMLAGFDGTLTLVLVVAMMSLGVDPMDVSAWTNCSTVAPSLSTRLRAFSSALRRALRGPVSAASCRRSQARAARRRGAMAQP